MGTALNCSIAEVSMVDGMRGVQTEEKLASWIHFIRFCCRLGNILGPGHTQLTRMPL